MKLVLVQLPLRARAGDPGAAILRRLLEAGRLALRPDDVLVLPELWSAEGEREAYEGAVRGLARGLGCHVVGGSHHELRGPARVNSGIVADADGCVVGRYEKLRPYGRESLGVAPGQRPGEVVIAGRRALVVLCADFWFSDVLQRARALPDLVLVPACSVTRKPSPRFARALWRHMAVARAYEFNAFVGISDWARNAAPAPAPAAIAGLADPTRTEPRELFTAVGRGGLAVHTLDLAALDALRADRRARGFLWSPAPSEPPAPPDPEGADVARRALPRLRAGLP